ncbi:MAG: hypothetical protein FWG63_04725 [Defluviitaleaceae bacterium]|nr:hypothetical protein [Defluviitaleaceae bacterium]
MTLATKLKLIFIQLLPFIFVYVFSQFFLDVYLLEWTSRNFYMYIWVLIIPLTLSNKVIISFSITIGNFIGILIGHFLGEFIRNVNISTITEATTPQDWARLHAHHGWAIWIVVVCSSLIVGTIIHKIKIVLNKRRTHLAEF